MSFRTALGAATVAAAFVCGGPASATTLAALASDGTTIYLINLEKAKVTKTLKLKGLNFGRTLTSIGYRTSDAKVYGIVVQFGDVYEVDVEKGKVKGIDATLNHSGLNVSIDENPVDHYFRAASSVEYDDFWRLDVDGGLTRSYGSLRFAGSAADTQVVGIAHTNAFLGATATQVFDIEATRNVLATQSSESATLTEVGKLGVKIKGPIGFDILSKKGGNAAWMIANRKLYPIDLTTGKAGKATAVKLLKGDVIGMTFLGPKT